MQSEAYLWDAQAGAESMVLLGGEHSQQLASRTCRDVEGSTGLVGGEYSLRVGCRMRLSLEPMLWSWQQGA